MFCLSQLPCKVMAVLLHFFFLSAFAWMLVEGLHLYSMVVKVFGSEGSKHFYYYGIGWGRSAALGSYLPHSDYEKTPVCFLIFDLNTLCQLVSLFLFFIGQIL